MGLMFTHPQPTNNKREITYISIDFTTWINISLYFLAF
jgi:hypothetical protein